MWEPIRSPVIWWRPKKRFVYRVYAVDTTEQDKLTEELEEARNRAEQNKTSLEATLAQIRNTRKQKELLKIKGQVHHFLGYKLSLLTGILAEKKGGDLDIKKIKAIINSILDELGPEQSVSASSFFRDMQLALEYIGVELSMEGDFPEEPGMNRLFISLITEGATNAIKHSHAKSIQVIIEKTDDMEQISVCNDGECKEQVIYGGGLSSIEKMAKEQGATMKVLCTTDGFVLQITHQK